jgi:ceramide glucosyltransferase
MAETLWREETSMDLLVVTLCLGAALSLLLFAISSAAVFVVSARKAAAAPVFPVSILKPLKGLDDGLWENLVSIVEQQHPAFELVLGAEDADDPALEVAQRLRRAFPDVRIVVVAGAARVALNPKVSLLFALSRAARFENLLISDSNVRVDPRYLRAITAELADEHVGLVSSLVVGDREQSLGALLENLHLASFIARSVCTGTLVGHACVVGKSMLVRRSALAALGGLDAVRDVLAEDYVLGRLFTRAGFRVALSAHAVTTISVQRSVADFFSRHLRWSQMRRRIAPLAFLCEPLGSPGPWLFALIGAGFAGSGAGPLGPRALVLAGLLGVSVIAVVEAGLLARLRGKVPSPTELVWTPLRDFVALAAWAVASVRTTVTWRGNRLRIGPGSVLSVLPPASRPVRVVG